MYLNNMILIDVETVGLNVKSGIYEVALMIIENNKPIDKYHFCMVENESKIHLGKGQGYKDCSGNEVFISSFKSILNKYKYPLVAHDGTIYRKILLHYKWINKNYEFYDATKAIKSVNNDLLSYSPSSFLGYFSFEMEQTHVAIEDIHLLWNLLQVALPTTWIPIKDSINKKTCPSNKKSLDAMQKSYKLIRDAFHGKLIVFTGKGQCVRNELMQLAKKCGANVSNTITKKTDILVVGIKASNKINKAKKYGVHTMSMNDFYEIVKDIPLDKEKIS